VRLNSGAGFAAWGAAFQNAVDGIDHSGNTLFVTGGMRADEEKGSARESEKSMISRGFPQDEEFGFQGGHSLGFQ
jgi:hypothetical protein